MLLELNCAKVPDTVLFAKLIVLFKGNVSSCKTTVPVAFGKLTVLSAVGSITVNVVSKSSEV